MTPGHIKEALEHAYPNSVTEEDLATSLRCTLAEVQDFLAILEKEGQIESLQNGEWIRKAYSKYYFLYKSFKLIHWQPCHSIMFRTKTHPPWP